MTAAAITDADIRRAITDRAAGAPDWRTAATGVLAFSLRLLPDTAMVYECDPGLLVQISYCDHPDGRRVTLASHRSDNGLARTCVLQDPQDRSQRARIARSAERLVRREAGPRPLLVRATVSGGVLGFDALPSGVLVTHDRYTSRALVEPGQQLALPARSDHRS